MYRVYIVGGTRHKTSTEERSEIPTYRQPMLRLSSRASQLTYQSLKTTRFFVTPLGASSLNGSFRPLSQGAARHLSSSLRPIKPRHRTEFSSNRLPNRQAVRHCSCQRAMCTGDADLPGGSMDVKNARVLLPTNVKPLHYDLTLEPDFENFTYEGNVVIEYVQSRF